MPSKSLIDATEISAVVMGWFVRSISFPDMVVSFQESKRRVHMEERVF